jgi:radical SAM superfamily enzyme YgiQ (UPF0313 family)
MVGYPGENEQDILQTIDYLKAANPTLYDYRCVSHKGTSLYEEIENKITVQPDWETTTDRQIDFKREYRENIRLCGV